MNNLTNTKNSKGYDDKILNIPEFIPDHVNKFFDTPVLFTFILIFAATYGPSAIVVPPNILKLYNKRSSDIYKNIIGVITRFIYITTIAFTATSNFSIAIVVSLIFLIFLYLVRTPKQRRELYEKTGFIF